MPLLAFAPLRLCVSLVFLSLLSLFSVCPFNAILYAGQASDTAGSSRRAVSFSREIAPLLVKKCLKCHDAEKAKGRYQVHTFALLMKPGDSGSASIVAADPAKSELFRRISTKDEDDRMPQKDDPLPAAQIGLIERWIQEGAKFDGADPATNLAALVPREPYPNPPEAYHRPVPVTALAFSPDGKELAVSGYHEITIWNFDRGKLLRRIKNVCQRTYSLAYHPDGARIAAAGGAPGQSGEIALYDPRQSSLARTLGTSGDVVLTLCFSPDGERLAAGGADNAIRVYDVGTGKEELLIQQHADWVTALVFSRDGKHLASASRDRSSRIYSSATGGLETSYNDHKTSVAAVALDNDGKQAFSAGQDKKILIWSTADARKLGEIGNIDGDITKLLLDERVLFSSSTDKTIRQYDAPDRKLLRTYSGHEDWVYALTYHAAAKRLASGSHDGEVRIWNTDDGSLVAVFTAAPGYQASASNR